MSEIQREDGLIEKIGDNITLYLGDCLEVMKEIPDGDELRSV